jgi:hypothetical protein
MIESVEYGRRCFSYGLGEEMENRSGVGEIHEATCSKDSTISHTFDIRVCAI